MRPLSDLFGATEFAIGVLIGTVALLITLPAALGIAALLPRKGRRPGLVGPTFAAGGVLALNGRLGTDEIAPVPDEVILGLVLLWLAGAIAARTPSPWLVGPIASLPGGLLIAGANQGLAAGWVPVLIVVGSAVVGATAADLDRRAARYGLGPLLFFLAVLGIYFTVPDTELMRAIVGVSLPLVLLAWPYAAASLGSGGAYAAVGLVLWVAPIEAIGRPGALVGTVGAFALLVGEPLGRALAPHLERRVRINRFPIGHPRAVVVGAQLVLVLYASRVAGMAHDGLVAFLLMIPAIAVAVGFGVFLVLPERRHRRRKRKPGNGTPGSTSSSGRSSSPTRSSSRSGRRPSSNGSTKRGSNGDGRRDG
jgi:hypothetical protein